MGTRLHDIALHDARWQNLSYLHWKILADMAYHALDFPLTDTQTGTIYPAGLYYKGHDHLARLIKGTVPYPDDADTSQEAHRIRLDRQREIRRHIAALEKAGAIETAGDGRRPRPGHAQTYRLTFAGEITSETAQQPDADASAPESRPRRQPKHAKPRRQRRNRP